MSDGPEYGSVAWAHAEVERMNAARRRQVETVTYRDAKAFDRDAKIRLATGWEVLNSETGGGRVTLTRVAVFGLFAMGMKKGHKAITVTWTKG